MKYFTKYLYKAIIKLGDLSIMYNKDRLNQILNSDKPVVTFMEFAEYVNTSIFVLRQFVNIVLKNEIKKRTVLGLNIKFFFIVKGKRFGLDNSNTKPLSCWFEIPNRNITTFIVI